MLSEFFMVTDWLVDWLIDWLVHLYPPITRKRRCAMLWTNPHPLRSWLFSKLYSWRLDFFPHKFAACSKPPSRDNYCKACNPRTQQRDQSAGWAHDHAIRIVVKNDAFTLLATQPTKCFKYEMRCIVPYCLPSRATICKRTLYVVKVRTIQIALSFRSKFALLWKCGMGCGRKF